MSEKKSIHKENAKTENNTSNPQAGPTHSQMWMSGLTWLLLISSMLYFWNNIQSTGRSVISYSQFKQELNRDNIKQVLIKQYQLTGEYRFPASHSGDPVKKSDTFETQIPSIGDSDLLKLLEEKKVDIKSVSDANPLWITIVFNTAPWLIFIVFILYGSRLLRNSMGSREGGFGFSKSRARHHSSTDINTRYDDVAGLESAKRDLQEVIDYLKTPERYQKLGARIPKGMLMMGPPGCGKTLLAKATAGEAGVPFFSVSGSEFIEMFVGVGASRVRDMFNDARKQAPALIFIDEIDSVGRVRGTGMGGGNDEREQTLNQILAEMDGFSSDEVVVVLAATNRPDVLDPALMRPGRFDRKLVLELPGREAREAILNVHTRNVPLAPDVSIANIASETVGFSGADLENLVNESALAAAREQQQVVNSKNFSDARDKIVLGATRGEIISDSEKERVAYHEAGHALTAYLSPNADPVNKVSIIPRGRSLGMTEQLPIEERHNYTQSYLEERLCIMLGGRAAEQLQFADVSSGAADDLKNATNLARQMVTQWGMSERIGPVNCQQSEEHPFLGREMTAAQKNSEYSSRKIDKEIYDLIVRCEQISLQRLRSHFDDLNALAMALLDRESLQGKDIQQLLAVKPAMLKSQ